MRKPKPISFLQPSPHVDIAHPFIECQRHIDDYLATTAALFKDDERQKHPDIPLMLIHKAAAAGMTLDRLCSALPVHRSTVIAAVKRAGAVLDGRSQLIQLAPSPRPTLPTPDATTIFETLMKDENMTAVPSIEPVKSRKPRRKGEEVQRLIDAAIEKCLAETGKHPSRASVAKLTGISFPTVARRWPQNNDVAPSREAAPKEREVKIITSLSPARSLSADDEAAVELVSQRSFGHALVPGMVPLGDDTYRCDVMKKNEAGELVAHCEAWRLQLPEVRKIVMAFQKLRG